MHNREHTEKTISPQTQRKLLLVKIIHTLIWLFFNVVIFYMLYAAITDKVDIWLWAGFALVFLEGIVLLIFKQVCPVTLVARKYSVSDKHNFDIFLPEWLAKYNKTIYSSIVALVIIILIVKRI